MAGPLQGLPIVLKDSINTADMPTTAGTPALEGFIPTSSAPVVQILTDAGAIVLGKTNLHELSAGYTTNNTFTGSTRNPYDTDRIPGGTRRQQRDSRRPLCASSDWRGHRRLDAHTGGADRYYGV